MKRPGIFFISDYRNVDCNPSRDPSFWILRELNRKTEWKTYATANKIINKNCFRNIDFLELNYKGDIQIQNPIYNFLIYKYYKKFSKEIKIVHHREMFQIGRGYNLIPIIENEEEFEGKTLIVGPVESPHKVFESDFIQNSTNLVKIAKLAIYRNRDKMRKLFEKLYIMTVENADVIIVPTKEARKEVLNFYNSAAEVKIINYGVNLDEFKRFRYRPREDNFNVIFAGGALERKGVEYLLEAIKIVKSEYPQVKLYLISEGYRVPFYKEKVRLFGIWENVTFLPRLERNKYLELLSKCRIMCLPTLSEGYGWTVLDAVCIGVPVITTTECRCNDLFEGGDVGVRVNPRDSEGLAEAISRLFGDPELCKKFCKNGLKKREMFDYKNIVSEYIDLYDNFI